MLRLMLLGFVFVLLPLLTLSACPFASSSQSHSVDFARTHPDLEEYSAALAALDWAAVKADIKAFLTTSNPFWPSDFGNYGPFMIRQGWHCAGSYRKFDGRGGCDGGRQRFDPERSWDDNTNLDKAKKLLQPIKLKYGLGLSWGDLIMLTATTAIESMGGPVLGFCGGRIDDYDGTESLLLGPTDIQNKTYPCPVNGQCTSPLGATTIGLIYVNPEGPMGQPNPAGSAPQVRDTFGRMNMNDAETVALIGAHAFGKTHGACPLGPGPSPKEDPTNPWPGRCGTGKGRDTFTSGFEGSWTLTPTKWSNSYYKQLLTEQWKVAKGPGGHYQWAPQSGKPIMMLTSDLSLVNDASYKNIVSLYASNISALNDAFSHAWYKLATRDMGPVTRCVGPWVPPPQPFQYPLPAPPTSFPDWNLVRQDVLKVIHPSSVNSSALAPDMINGVPYYGAVFVHLAFQCASTYRQTDYLGGCNGARIRFPPQSGWVNNAGMNQALQLLAPIKNKYAKLSWADLIVFAGNVALDDASSDGVTLPFCPGRTDASDGAGSADLSPNFNYSSSFDQYRFDSNQVGLTDREAVVLSARLRSTTQMGRMGYFGSYTKRMNVLSNQYFATLLSSSFTKVSVGSVVEYVTADSRYMCPIDMGLSWDSTYLSIAQEYASDNNLFLKEFRAAWTRLMNVDRFSGPTGNVCNSPKSNAGSNGQVTIN